jgi:hypothetical protein
MITIDRDDTPCKCHSSGGKEAVLLIDFDQSRLETARDAREIGSSIVRLSFKDEVHVFPFSQVKAEISRRNRSVMNSRAVTAQ